MAWVIGMVSTIPLRKEASHRSEMVSELLFGELAEVIETNNGFTKLKCLYDGYEGWCQSNQLSPITEAEGFLNNKQLVAEWTSELDFNGRPMYVSFGSPLAVFQNGKSQINKFSITFHGVNWDSTKAVFSADSIKAIANKFINTPYLWGGRSVFGIDCSGFVQQVFRFFNKPLPRDASQQAIIGEVVGFLQEVQCGDLAFFDNEEGRITHVGLLFNSDTIIHAAGKVRVDKIDNMGIVNTDTGERTHKLRIIKRY